MKLIHNNPYYHGTIKRFLAVFNSIFDEIVITKTDSSGNTLQTINVPISVGPKNKWLHADTVRPELQRQQVEMTLPRLSSEIVEYRYAQDRKIGTVGTYVKGENAAGEIHKIFNPAPYDAIINLHSMCKTQEESLQILEQILPYFAPSLLVEFETLPEFGIKKVVPISISSVSVFDTYEGSAEEFRTVTQTFTFTAQLDLFGPTAGPARTGGVIYKADSNIHTDINLDSPVKDIIEAIGDPVTKTETVTITEPNFIP